jgi:3-deoxy-D-manno-octulosonic-acid transferase
MNTLFFVVYNILYPVFLFFVFFLSIFNKKIRVGLAGRFESIHILNKYFNQNNIKSNIYWFHCSSYGEYLQVEQIINGLKKKENNCIILLSFFSPSGFVNCKNDNVDCKIYLPFDFLWTIKKAIKIVSPNAIVLANNDIWYNFLNVSQSMNVKTYLIGAESKRFYKNKFSAAYYFYKPIYFSFSKIFAVDENDQKDIFNYLKNKTISEIPITGNPRFDQVIQRSKKQHESDKIDISKRADILLMASMHKEDRNMILAQLIKYLKNTNIQVYWISHEPNSQENKYLCNIFNRNSLSTEVIDSIQSIGQIDSRVVIINAVGVLADLYWTTKVAYVGGGFSSGVHNLMEPAVAGVPMIFGPRYKKFKEAVEIVSQNAGRSISKSIDFNKFLDFYFNSEENLTHSSKSARNIILNHSGASVKILNHLNS